MARRAILYSASCVIAVVGLCNYFVARRLSPGLDVRVPSLPTILKSNEIISASFYCEHTRNQIGLDPQQLLTLQRETAELTEESMQTEAFYRGPLESPSEFLLSLRTGDVLALRVGDESFLYYGDTRFTSVELVRLTTQLRQATGCVPRPPT